MKISLWLNQLSHQNFCHFHHLQSLNSAVINTDTYVTMLQDLKMHFDMRFQDFEAIKPQLELFCRPLAATIENVPPELQLELIDIMNTTLLKHAYNDLDVIDFYRSLSPLQYPNIRKFAAQIITIFASTYTCEQFFSLMKLTKPRLRAKLSDQNLVAAIRLACSTISPDIPKLVSQKMGNEFHDTSP